jgi:hypothetical protein
VLYCTTVLWFGLKSRSTYQWTRKARIHAPCIKTYYGNLHQDVLWKPASLLYARCIMEYLTCIYYSKPATTLVKPPSVMDRHKMEGCTLLDARCIMEHVTDMYVLHQTL